MGAPYGLDFTAVLMLAEAMGAMSPLLAGALPSVEAIILEAYRKEGADAD